MSGRFDYVFKKSEYIKEVLDQIKQKMDENKLEYKDEDYGLFFVNDDYKEVIKIQKEIMKDDNVSDEVQST